MALRYTLQARLYGSSAVAAVAFSPDGAIVASAGLDGSTCVWQLSDYSLLYKITNKTPALSLAWASNNVLVGGLQDGTIINMTIKPKELSLSGFWAHQYPVECLSMSQDLLASGGREEVHIWRADNPADQWLQTAALPIPPKNSFNRLLEVIVTSLHWFTDAGTKHMLLVSYMNHGVHIFDGSTWELVRSIPIHGTIADTSLSIDAKLLAVSNVLTGFDICWTETGAALCSVGHQVQEYRKIPVLFCHDSLALLGGHPDGDVHLWDVGSGRKLHSLMHQAGDQVLSLASYYDEVQDTFLIATGVLNSDKGSLIIWKAKDIRRGELLREEAPRPDAAQGLKNTLAAIAVFAWVAGMAAYARTQ